MNFDVSSEGPQLLPSKRAAAVQVLCTAQTSNNVLARQRALRVSEQHSQQPSAWSVPP